MTTKPYLTLVCSIEKDIQNHKDNGVDLNPYSTGRARSSWQKGFDGKPCTLLDWSDCYQRGKMVAYRINNPL